VDQTFSSLCTRAGRSWAEEDSEGKEREGREASFATSDDKLEDLDTSTAPMSDNLKSSLSRTLHKFKEKQAKTRRQIDDSAFVSFSLRIRKYSFSFPVSRPLISRAIHLAVDR